jgi:predicted transcriptional regulator
MPVGLRRSDLEIIRDILRTDWGKGPTQLRYKANLSHPQLQRYLAFLEQSNLVEMERQSPRGTNVRLTDKGRQVLKQLDGLFLTLGFDTPTENGGPV